MVKNAITRLRFYSNIRFRTAPRRCSAEGPLAVPAAAANPAGGQGHVKVKKRRKRTVKCVCVKQVLRREDSGRCGGSAITGKLTRPTEVRLAGEDPRAQDDTRRAARGRLPNFSTFSAQHARSTHRRSHNDLRSPGWGQPSAITCLEPAIRTDSGKRRSEEERIAPVYLLYA